MRSDTGHRPLRCPRKSCVRPSRQSASAPTRCASTWASRRSRGPSGYGRSHAPARAPGHCLAFASPAASSVCAASVPMSGVPGNPDFLFASRPIRLPSLGGSCPIARLCSMFRPEASPRSPSLASFARSTAAGRLISVMVRLGLRSIAEDEDADPVGAAGVD